MTNPIDDDPPIELQFASLFDARGGRRLYGLCRQG